MDSWREVHQRVKKLWLDRAALEHAEMELLRDIKRFEVWKQFGCSMLEYLERELGLTPRVAIEKIRMSAALISLPAIDAALARGERTFSVVRELTRVATPETERVWLDWSAGKIQRDVEHQVSGREKGMLPTDPVDHEALVEKLWFQVKPATRALVQQARSILCGLHGETLEDDAFVAAMARAVIDGPSTENGVPHQIAIKKCPSCEKGWQTAGGVDAPITAAQLAAAECDALLIGSLDGDEPERASHTIPPAIRRFVLARDGFKCTVTGCRVTWGLHADHLGGKAETGKIDNSPKRLTSICGTHHHAKHDGLLLVWGDAPNLTWVRVENPIDRAVVQAAVEEVASRGLDRHVAAELVGRAVREIHTHEGTSDIHSSHIVERVAQMQMDRIHTHVGKEDLISFLPEAVG